MNAIQQIIFNSFNSLPVRELSTYENDKESFYQDALITAKEEGISITAEELECVHKALFTDDDGLDFGPLTDREQAEIDALFD